MSSGGGGSTFIPEVDIGKALGDLVNVGVNYASMGLLGYDANTGKAQPGVVTRGLDEAIGETTGRNAAREEAAKTRERLDVEARNRADLAAKELERQRLLDINASNSVQGMRASASAKARKASGLGGAEDEMTKDFLGL